MCLLNPIYLNNMEDVRAKDVMQKKQLSVHPKDSIQKVNELFNLTKDNHLIVLVDSKPVGIISRGDVLFGQYKLRKDQGPIPKKFLNHPSCAMEVMTDNPLTVDENAKLDEVLDQFLIHHINAIPVVKDDCYTGMITTFDMMALLKRII